MQRPKNLKKGDKFRVIEEGVYFNVGEIVSLKEDGGSDNPCFWNEDKTSYSCIHLSKLEPYNKSIRDAQVGDVVVYENGGYERIVLERGKNTVLLSHINNFKIAGYIYTLDSLEEAYCTLKAEPVVDDKTTEAMKLLKEAGYKVTFKD